MPSVTTRDYTIPVHGEQRGLLHVGIELRQDLRRHRCRSERVGGTIGARARFNCRQWRFLVQIRLGYELIYQSAQPTPMILNLNVHYTRAADLVRADHMMTDPWVPSDPVPGWIRKLVHSARGAARTIPDHLGRHHH